MAEVFALQSLFEGLFVQALQPTGAFKERLKDKGFDLDHRQARYPIAVWRDCLDLTVAELFPGVARPEAWALIGDRFAEGYFQTLIGKMIATTLPFLSPRTFLMRSPRFITTGLENVDLSFRWQDEKTSVLVLRGSGELAGHLMEGVSRNVFRRMKVAGVQFFPRALEGLDAELKTVLP